jgi:hypothetical protein
MNPLRYQQVLGLLCLCLLSACFSRSSAMTYERFENIEVGTSIASLTSEIGKPYSVHSKGGSTEEYEYIERIDMGQQPIAENHYFLVVQDGKVVSKRVKRQRPPAFDLIYQEDPIPE